MREPIGSEQSRPYTARTPLAFWLMWALAIVAVAVYTWWSALSAGVPLDMAQLVLRSLIVGLIGLIVLTRLEARLAPWHFLG